MSSTNPRGGSSNRGGASYRGGERGGRGRGGGADKNYAPGSAPYQRGGKEPSRGERGAKRGDRGRGKEYQPRGGYKGKKEISAEDQFDMLFGAQDKKKTGNELMDLLGVSDDAIVDDAIIEDDGAIIVEEDLSEADKAILNAAKQKPLWEVDDFRVQYTKDQMLAAFVKEEAINFDLFDKDYMSVYDVFN
jgi:hypothetical protein